MLDGKAKNNVKGFVFKAHVAFRSLGAGAIGYIIAWFVLTLFGYGGGDGGSELDLDHSPFDELWPPIVAGLFGLLCAVNYFRHKLMPPKEYGVAPDFDVHVD